MDELEKNIPDDFWRKTFDESAEMPPSRVWDAIERELDEANGPKILPLWGSGLASSRPFIWGTGVAAALALLFVGWWAIDTPVINHGRAVAQTHVSGKGNNPENVGSNAATSTVQANTNGQRQTNDVNVSGTASAEKPATLLAGSASSTVDRTGMHSKGEAMAQSMKPSAQQRYSLRRLATATSGTSTSSLSDRPATATLALLPPDNRMAAASYTSSSSFGESSPSASAVSAVYKELLRKPIRMRSPGPIQRIVWYRPADLDRQPEMSKESHKKREMWASASVMPGAFNPMVSVPAMQTSYANTLVANTTSRNSSSVNSRGSFSVAYQAGAGVQLTERWSLESGIGYLAGHSTVETPAQSAVTSLIQGAGADRGTANNLYADALKNSSSSNLANYDPRASAATPSNNYAYLTQGNNANQSLQTLTNDYQYVQVPIQVGYQLRPRKRLSLAVLGGLLTNIFVRNTVGTDLVVTAQDGVYRPVSLAASMGARFRYRPSGRWSASLAGLYQPSLEVGTQSNSQVQTRPTSTGMSFGVDYHF
ncbi:anti-sigma factor [Spirosoma koreense]